MEGYRRRNISRYKQWNGFCTYSFSNWNRYRNMDFRWNYSNINILRPNIFLPAAFILCSIVSVLIGSSFGTVATMGIVLMGVGEGLGLPAAMTAGAVVAGSIFGDKVSPMSDSTNLTAAMSGTPLFSHVKSMLYVSGPAVIISLILYYFIGKGAVSSTTDFSIVE